MKPARKRTKAEIRAALQAGENDFDDNDTTGIIEVALELAKEKQEQAQAACRAAAQIAENIGRAMKRSTYPPPVRDPDGRTD